VEREDREEQEADAGGLSLRTVHLQWCPLDMPWSSRATDPLYRTLAGTPYNGPGLIAAFVTYHHTRRRSLNDRYPHFVSRCLGFQVETRPHLRPQLSFAHPSVLDPTPVCRHTYIPFSLYDQVFALGLLAFDSIPHVSASYALLAATSLLLAPCQDKVCFLRDGLTRFQFSFLLFYILYETLIGQLYITIHVVLQHYDTTGSVMKVGWDLNGTGVKKGW
jgi:hypothetical protein